MPSNPNVEFLYRYSSTPSVELPFNFVSKWHSTSYKLFHKVSPTVCWWELLIRSIVCRNCALYQRLPSTSARNGNSIEALLKLYLHDLDEETLIPEWRHRVPHPSMRRRRKVLSVCFDFFIVPISFSCPPDSLAIKLRVQKRAEMKLSRKPFHQSFYRARLKGSP